MPPFLSKIIARSPTFNPGIPSGEFSDQWKHPGDVFSVLLILGGDVVGRALAQFAGGWLRPPSFSFGWVAYSINALVSAVGENKLMPTPDCACIAINGKSGYPRSNSSWILGRMVRDYESWMDREIKEKVDQIIDKRWAQLKDEAKKKGKLAPERPKQAGLCVSIYRPTPNATAGEPMHDKISSWGFAVAIFQLGIASIPCGLFGDWGILMITVCGIILSSVMASLPQWKNEKWACRRLPEDSEKKVVFTRGNGSQHAIVIVGSEGFLDLEDLASGQTNVDVSVSTTTRVTVAGLALFWVLLLITAAGLKQNTWFLLAVGGIGILQNVFVAGWRRHPRDSGIPIDFVEVFGDMKVMETLYAVEDAYPYLGRSLLETFFPGKLRPDERNRWDEYERTAKTRETAKKAGTASAGTASAGTQNTGTPNAGTQNTGLPNTGTPNAGTQNTGLPNTGTPNAGPLNSGPPDAGPPDAGLPNAGLSDAVAPDTGAANAGTQNPGTQNP